MRCLLLLYSISNTSMQGTPEPLRGLGSFASLSAADPGRSTDEYTQRLQAVFRGYIDV